MASNPEVEGAGAATVALPPERRAGQGLGPHQQESGNHAILSLLADPAVRDQVDLVMTYRQQGDEAVDPEAPAGTYEVWSRRGLVRFRRLLPAVGPAPAFEVVEVVGENPLDRQEADALASLDAEREAARATGHESEPSARRFIGTGAQSYPFAYERVAQLFDSPHAPDLVISPEDWSFGTQPGQHGALNVRQSRAPLWLAGAGVRPGRHQRAARAVDIAPTVLAALGFPPVAGRDGAGRDREAGEGGVLLRRQDGEVLADLLDPALPPPERLYVFLLDGLHATELEACLTERPEDYPGLVRLRERAAQVAHGSIVNFPSITWPSHTAIGTGSWCGHHDVVNPSYWLRDRQEMVSPQGQQVRTEGFSSPEVESLYEAFHRVRGEGCVTAAIHAPFGRGARHAVLEGRNLLPRERLKALTRELAVDEDPRWQGEGLEELAQESHLDTRGLAQVVALFTDPERPAPDLVFHELILTDGVGHHFGPHSPELRAALAESDRRIVRVLDLLEAEGLLQDTLFVVTADHGMAPQDVALRANPAHHVRRAGLVAEVAEPMIWLRDVAVEATRAPDGRTGRVRVAENDPAVDGERAPLAGARVEVFRVRPGAEPEPLCQGRTGAEGIYGFATPADWPDAEIEVQVRASGRNPRRLGLDGRPSAPDPRALLYGDA